MMSDWKTDGELYDAAEAAANKLIELINHEGQAWVPSPNAPPNVAREGIEGSIHLDAQDCLSLDPQKIIDEYERMQKLGRALDIEQESDINDRIREIDYSIQEWHGDGADAFRAQLSRIETFFGQQ
jgi:hypothetical protein